MLDRSINYSNIIQIIRKWNEIYRNLEYIYDIYYINILIMHYDI